jgi:hypothetical protein
MNASQELLVCAPAVRFAAQGSCAKRFMLLVIREPVKQRTMAATKATGRRFQLSKLVHVARHHRGAPPRPA